MGGDYAPEAAVLGAIQALDVIREGSRIVLFGDKPQIEQLLAREGCSDAPFEIVHSEEVIQMSEHPTQAFTKKPNSSIAMGFGALKEGAIDGFASAGNTGAMLVGCMYTVRQIPGIIRPTISSVVPAFGGGHVMLLDVGLNVDCKPDVLYQYGIIGSIYAESVLGIKNPRVGLLNIGEEREKGNLQSKATYELMEGTTEFNFVGNVEAKHLFTGEFADIIVCDGFVGNTIIKQAEGLFEIVRKQGITGSYLDNLNYEGFGGTPILGVNGAVIIGHGCSSPLAIRNMILQTEKTILAQVATKLREIFQA